MKIYLRPITPNDTRNIVKWRNTKEVRSHCMDKSPISEESHMDFYKNFVETGKYKQFIVERIEESSHVASYPIATIYLKDIDNNNHRCELCIFTSSDEEWRQASQSIAISMMLEKAFSEFGIHKVYSYVFAKHSDEIALLKTAGFEEEAVLKEESLNINGEYEDVIRMSIVNDNKINNHD